MGKLALQEALDPAPPETEAMSREQNWKRVSGFKNNKGPLREVPTLNYSTLRGILEGPPMYGNPQLS